jgi:hypothetical protein
VILLVAVPAVALFVVVAWRWIDTPVPPTMPPPRRRCVCGVAEMFGAGDYTCELAGTKHRTDGPCYRCDTFGNPL